MKIENAHGQVAQVINNYGGVRYGGSPLGPSKHDRFLELAKEVMPIPCHDQLDWLVRHSDVHARCLLLACKNKALVCRNGRLERAKAFPDYSMGGLSISILLAFGAYATLLWIALNANLSQGSQLILFGCMAASTLGIWWLQRQFFYPHVVARTATEALARRDAT